MCTRIPSRWVSRRNYFQFIPQRATCSARWLSFVSSPTSSRVIADAKQCLFKNSFESRWSICSAINTTNDVQMNLKNIRNNHIVRSTSNTIIMNGNRHHQRHLRTPGQSKLCCCSTTRRPTIATVGKSLRLRFTRNVNRNIQKISTSVNCVTSRFFWLNTRKIQNIQK